MTLKGRIGYNSPLMSRQTERLPVQVDPFRLAQAGRIYEGELPLQKMKRLGAALSDDAGQVHVQLEFNIDSMDVPFLCGKVTGTMVVECQRCLEPMPLAVDIDLSLAFVRDAVAAEGIPGPYEPYIVDSVPIMLLDMIEEELLLFLPAIARHELTECPARDWVENHPEPEDSATQTEERQNPFSVLANLKSSNKGK